MTSRTADGGGRMMVRMPNIQTASSHANSMSAVTTTGHKILPGYRSTLSGMAGLDHFAEMADQAVERLVLRHGDMPGPREIDGQVVMMVAGRRPMTTTRSDRNAASRMLW